MIEEIIIVGVFVIGFVIARFYNWQKWLPKAWENKFYQWGFKKAKWG